MAGFPPSIVSQSIVTPNFLKYAQPRVPGGPALVLSTVTDAGSSPTTRIRAGNVVVYKTASTAFVLATDATGDRNAPASVSTLVVGDASWNSAVMTFTLDGGVSFTVTLGGATATVAAAVTDLNGNAVFAGSLIADSNATFLRVRTRRGGKNVYLACSSSATNMYGSGITLSGKGTDADYRVLEQPVDLLDNNGVAVSNFAPTLLAGAFIAASMLNSTLTAEARAVLERLGAIFY